MKRRSLTILILAVAGALRQAPAQTETRDSITVRDAVAMVLTRNPALQEASHTIEASKARVDQSRSSYLPSADVEASYVFLAPLSVFTLPGGAINVFPSNNYDGHVGLRQMIFDFQKTGSQVKLADSRVTLAEDARETIRRDLAYRCVESFYAILFLRRSIMVQEEQIRTLQEHLETTNKKIAGGTATQLDALTTQVRVAAAQTLRINLENSLHRQEIALRRLAALPADAPVNPRGEFSPRIVSLNQDSLLAAALANRIEAKAADDAIASAKAQQQAARSSDAPSLNANVAYGLKNGYIPNLDVLRGNVVAAVLLRVPILDGHRSSSMEEEATANLHAAEAKKQEINLAIQADVQQTLSEVRAAMERLQVSEINIQQANLAVETAKLRYEAGAIPNLDLLDATTNRAQAKLTNLEALYDFVLSSYQLRRAIGNPVFEE